MVLKNIKEAIAKTNIINFGAVLALIMWLVLTSVWLVLAVRSSDPLIAIKDVVIWSGSILLNILATYGILEAKREG